MIDRIQNREAARRRSVHGARALRSAAAATLALLTMGACDSLLEVELPGQLREGDLDQPRLASVLVRGVQGDFECALSRYVEAIGGWAHDFYRVDNFSRGRLTQQRSREVEIFEQNSCETNTFPQIYLPFQTVRVQGENTVARIEGFDAGAVENRDLLIATAQAYTGYAYQILGETMCELAFDSGPLVTRADSWRLAEQRFTSVINTLGSATAGEARSILSMALVGRARARLNLGNDAGVLEDAARVPRGFIRYAEMDASDTRRYNRVYDMNNQGRGTTVHPTFVGLTVGGVPDPRVPLAHDGLGKGFDGISDMWRQLKYPTLTADIPFATWREAQLMIAEVSGGQTAVNIINNLRATVAELPWVAANHPGLPAFSSTDPMRIREQVWEERRRELYLHGSKLGDMLRLQGKMPHITTLQFETGVNQRGHPYGPHTCYPLPDQEKLNNPNIN